ncbi:MAG TPA: hypothetical protein VIY47_10250 [Ignavibacteriaceae bacterium]
MAKSKHEVKDPESRITWDSRKTLAKEKEVIQILLNAGLPVSTGQEGETSEIVCVAEVQNNNIHAIVTAHNGHMYHFEPSEFELHFWKFAAENYYWVTQTMQDRQKVADLTGVSIKDVKGKTIQRSKEEGISGTSLLTVLKNLKASGGSDV